MIDAIGQVSKSIATKPITETAHLVAWLDETLRTLGIDRAAVVGMSMGTWIAAHYAMAYPERVERSALIAPAGLVGGLRLRFLLVPTAWCFGRRREPSGCLQHPGWAGGL